MQLVIIQSSIGYGWLTIDTITPRHIPRLDILNIHH